MSTFYDPIFATISIAVLIGIFGAFYGEFCSKIVYRLAGARFKGLPVLSASFCPSCGKKLRFVDKIPILSYFLLKGKCRRCGEPIAKRYLILELIGMLLPFFLLWFENFSFESILSYFILMALVTEFYIAYDTNELPVSISWFILLLSCFSLFFNNTIAGLLTGFLVGAISIFILLALINFNNSIQYSTVFFYASYSAFNNWKNALITIIVYIGLLILSKLYRIFSSKAKSRTEALLVVAIIVDFFFKETLYENITSFIQFLLS